MKKAIIITLSVLATLTAIVTAATFFVGDRYVGEPELDDDIYY